MRFYLFRLDMAHRSGHKDQDRCAPLRARRCSVEALAKGFSPIGFRASTPTTTMHDPPAGGNPPGVSLRRSHVTGPEALALPSPAAEQRVRRSALVADRPKHRLSSKCMLAAIVIMTAVLVALCIYAAFDMAAQRRGSAGPSFRVRRARIRPRSSCVRRRRLSQTSPIN